ncbi:MAG: hypothetical protein AAGF75_10885 [Cyanobacteria bacterium P01_H01_bin.130]
MVSPQRRPPTPQPSRRRQRRSGSSIQSPSARRPSSQRSQHRAPGSTSRPLKRKPTSFKKTPKTTLNRAIVVQTLELGIKLTVNGILGTAAIIGLAKLVPYAFHRHSGLQQLQAEAIAFEGRVQELQQDFCRYFDPKEAEAIARQETIRLTPNQRHIYFQSEPTSH